MHGATLDDARQVKVPLSSQVNWLVRTINIALIQNTQIRRSLSILDLIA